LIIERQRAEAWGKSVVERLAQDLQAEFPGVGGFSAHNIWRMRDFYLTYHANEKLSPLMAEIGWTHKLIIMSKFTSCAQTFSMPGTGTPSSPRKAGGYNEESKARPAAASRGAHQAQDRQKVFRLSLDV
jgi:hypothetical protein